MTNSAEMSRPAGEDTGLCGAQTGVKLQIYF